MLSILAIADSCILNSFFKLKRCCLNNGLATSFSRKGLDDGKGLDNDSTVPGGEADSGKHPVDNESSSLNGLLSTESTFKLLSSAIALLNKEDVVFAHLCSPSFFANSLSFNGINFQRIASNGKMIPNSFFILLY